jgi:hypothetical protein
MGGCSVKSPKRESDQDHLERICREIFLLEDQLRQAEKPDAVDYIETWKRLNRLKGQYKEMTGIYPVFPVSKPPA